MAIAHYPILGTSVHISITNRHI